MTFLQALYGSQYYEIHQKGKDGNRGRFSGNIFLSAFIILLIIAILMICIKFIPDFNEKLARSFGNTLGRSSGRSVGKLLAIPLFAVIYLVIAGTVGNATNFKIHVDAFMQYPDEIKKKANAKLLIPFFVLLVIAVGFAISSL